MKMKLKLLWLNENFLEFYFLSANYLEESGKKSFNSTSFLLIRGHYYTVVTPLKLNVYENCT